jgi:hypothetical protein
MKLEAGVFPVAAFTGLYLVTASAVSVGLGNDEFLFYIVVMLVLIAVVWFVHGAISLPGPLLWALSIWGLTHMAGGLIPLPADWPIDGNIRVLYSLWLVPDRLKYDQIVHAYGFGVATWVCWHGIRTAIASRGGDAAPTVGLLLLAALAGTGLGALNEIIEFAVTLMVPETNVGGYSNTGWDLVANLVGSTLAVILIRIAPAVVAGDDPA